MVATDHFRFASVKIQIHIVLSSADGGSRPMLYHFFSDSSRIFSLCCYAQKSLGSCPTSSAAWHIAQLHPAS